MVSPRTIPKTAAPVIHLFIAAPSLIKAIPPRER
jgi:hypothetical protein